MAYWQIDSALPALERLDGLLCFSEQSIGARDVA